MPTTTLTPSVQIGEILVPGATSLHGAKTFMLTRPTGGPNGVEVVFGLFSGETQKRVIDRLADRLFEELRPAIFAEGQEAEARFEAGLKRANSVILGFLHEHGLSLPGIKLRGAFGLLSGDRLFLSSRGSFRGVVVIPQVHVKPLAAFTLFEEGSDTLTHPKFFSSFQDGTLPPGARLFIASAELFQATDEAFAIGRFTDPDSSRAIRDLKNSLKASRLPVSVLTLAIPAPEQFTVPEMIEGRGPKLEVRPQTSNVKPAPKPDMADVGDLVSRGLRASMTGAVSGLRAAPKMLAAGGRNLAQGLMTAANLGARIVLTIVNLFRGEDGRFRLSTVRALPDRAMDAGLERINSIPRHRVAHFVALFVLVNVVGQAAIFTVRRQALVRDVKAYEGKLATIQLRQTEIESSLIYGDVSHAQEVASRLEGMIGTLPKKTDAQKRGAASALAALDTSRQRMRLAVTIEAPAVFATLAASANAKTLTWWKGGLYAFSSDKPKAYGIRADGTAGPAVGLKGIEAGIAQALPATTGIILLGTDGSLVFWNPSGDTVTPYGTSFNANVPLLFYQSRVYHQEPDGGVVRRNVQANALGSPIAAVASGAIGATVTGLAADGSLYVLTNEGAVRKFSRGTLSSTFHQAQVEPTPTQAADLVLGASRLAYLDLATDRVIVLDTRDGSLVAQASSPAFKDLRAATFDASGNRLLVLAGDGKVYALPLSQLKP